MKYIATTILFTFILGCSMVSPRSEIDAFVDGSNWVVESGEKTSAPYLLRYRSPTLSSQEIGGYKHLLRIVWIYAEENSGKLPSSDDLNTMAAFEELLATTIEKDQLAVLTAVLTFDGARQWVFYTDDVNKCGEIINSWPQTAEPFPIEIDTFVDPEWKYLRDEMLQGRA